MRGVCWVLARRCETRLETPTTQHSAFSPNFGHRRQRDQPGVFSRCPSERRRPGMQRRVAAVVGIQLLSKKPSDFWERKHGSCWRARGCSRVNATGLGFAVRLESTKRHRRSWIGRMVGLGVTQVSRMNGKSRGDGDKYTWVASFALTGPLLLKLSVRIVVRESVLYRL